MPVKKRLPIFCLAAFLGLASAAWAKTALPTPTVTPAPEAQALFEKAQDAFKAKRYSEAKKHLLQLVARFPMEPLVPKSRLLLAELEEDYEVSLEQFKILAQEYGHLPEGVSALKDLANRYYLADRYAEAAGAFRDYLKRDPIASDEAEARYWLGISQAALGQTKNAISQFDKAIHSDSEGKWAPKATLALGNAYLKQRRYTSALNQYLKILDKYPRFPEMNQVFLKMGRTYEALGKKLEAYATYRTLVSRFPRSQETPEAIERISELENQYPELRVRAGKENPVEGALVRPPATPTPEASAEAPGEAPTPFSAFRESFRVQVGVYSNKKYADLAVARVRKAGYEAELLTVKLSGTGATAFKVRSGRYGTREEARRAAEEIKSRLQLPTFVVAE